MIVGECLCFINIVGKSAIVYMAIACSILVRCRPLGIPSCWLVHAVNGAFTDERISKTEEE